MKQKFVVMFKNYIYFYSFAILYNNRSLSFVSFLIHSNQNSTYRTEGYLLLHIINFF
jgi:hypothetical protein